MKKKTHPVISALAKRGHKKFLENTTKEQRAAWVKKGGEATRRAWKLRKLQK